MSVNRYSVGYKDSASGRYAAMLDKKDGGYVSYEDYAELKQKLAESQREFRAADATIENLQMQVEKLAAELQSVKAMNDCLSEELRGYESDGAFEGPKMHLLWWQCETPNHDAFLAEVRAQGVDVAIEHLNKIFGSKEDIGEQVRALEWLAQALRKGAQS